MASSTLRTFLLILILFMARSAHPSFNSCEKTEVEAQSGGFVQIWQNSEISCDEESRTDSFEAVPVNQSGNPKMLYQLAQSQDTTSDQQRLLEDDKAFTEAKKEGTVDAMQRYLATYPDGIHAGEANIILVDLYDDLAYAQTKDEGTILSLARYLILFPDGKYADEVNAEFDRMQEYIAFAKEKLSEATTSNNQVSSPTALDLDSSEQQGQYEDGTGEFPVGTQFQDCKRCPQLVVVPAGRFTMGSDSTEEGSQSNEQPQHQVTISKPFAVGVFEVTRGEFRAFVEATNYQMGNACHASKGGKWRSIYERTWENVGYEQTDEHPVLCVGWRDAIAYVNWLSERTGANYRLLSEAEWEYVARAGTTGPFHTGNTIASTQANYNAKVAYGSGSTGSYRRKTVKVGSFDPNSFGLHDVHGNAVEWTQDCWNDSYQGAPNDGSSWQSGNCDLRVSRSSFWSFPPTQVRSAFRMPLDMNLGRYDISGIRVARELAP